MNERTKTDINYHSTSRQTVVTKKELLFQLQDCWWEDNLLNCIVKGKSHPDYQKYLYLVCLKFEFISGLICVPKRHDKGTVKLSESEYKKYLFEHYCDSLEELKDRLKEPVEDEITQQIFRTYNVIKDMCCRMMSSRETPFLYEYACCIDYVIGCGANIPKIEFDEYGLFPINIPHDKTELEKEFEQWNFRD